MSPAADVLRILSSYRHFLGNGIQVIEGWLAVGDVHQARCHLRLIQRRLSQDARLQKVADPEAVFHFFKFRSILEERGVEAEIQVGPGIRGFRFPEGLAGRVLENVERCSSCPRRGERALFLLNGRDHLFHLEWRMDCPGCSFSSLRWHWPSLALASGDAAN